VVGPNALSHGRPDYNDAIERTSAEQVLQNIVRVLSNEPPLFMDVSEVDAQLTFNSQLTGGEGGIGGKSGGGASGAVSGVSATGNVSATLQYAEQPTIRYVPLQGQALIQQITTPIDVDSLAKLFDSDWPLIAVLDLATDRVAPRYEDSYSALNAIAALDQYGALVLAAGKSPLSSKKEAAVPAPLPKGANAPPIVIQTGGGGGQGANDTLVLFFEPDRVGTDPITGRDALYPPDKTVNKPQPLRVTRGRDGELRITFNDYRPNGGDVCLPPPADRDAQRIAAKKNVLLLWLRLLAIYEHTQPLSDEKAAVAVAAPPDRAIPADRRRASSAPRREPHAPLPTYPTRDDRARLERSIDAAATLGELDDIAGKLPRWIELRTSLMAVGGYPSPAPVLRTRSALGILKAAAPQSTATPQSPIVFLSPAEAARVRAEPRNDPDLKTNFYALNGEEGNPTADWARTTHCFLYTRWLGPEDYSQAHSERELGYLRSYILIEQSPEPPSDPYLSVRGHDGQWYSIRRDDKISRVNFALIAQLLTMQAVPSQTPTPTPTPTIPVAGRGP
jgi:hypothetical protein